MRKLQSIHFIHAGNAYMPELNAYQEYLQKLGAIVFVHSSIDEVPDKPDVIWWICGVAKPIPKRIWKKAFIIHEYASASIGKLSYIKDKVKMLISPKPDYRIFLNEWVRGRIKFRDNVPFEYRDMGVSSYAGSPAGTEAKKPKKQYDFVYVGETSRLKCFIDVFELIASAKLSILIVGSIQKSLHRKLREFPNITMVGRVEQSEVINYLLKSKCGLNLMPNESPYIYQTSTKVLEYLNAGLPVISNKYKWVEEYSQNFKEQILFLTEDKPSYDIKCLFDKSQLVQMRDIKTISPWQLIVENLNVMKLIFRSKGKVANHEY